MTLKSAVSRSLIVIFISLLIPSCKSTIDQLTMSTCSAVETNIVRCSQLIADDISSKNTNTLVAVNEGDL